jgi:hypothetical protein
MTTEEVIAVVGPPSHTASRPDGTSGMIITRPHSSRWLQMDFDAQRRLTSFEYDEF